MMKRIFSALISLTLLCTILPTAMALNTPASGEYSTISAGAECVAAIQTDGSLWVWGNDAFNQLGDGALSPRNRPFKLMDNIVSVSMQHLHVAAIKTDGSLWTWGLNTSGQLGTDTDGMVPVHVMDNVAAVSVGNRHTAAIKTDGSLWTWGSNGGRLGDGTTADRITPVKVMDDVVAVSAGVTHTAAIKADGSLWTWGDNHGGELGDGTVGSITPTPVKVLDNVVAVSAGNCVTAAITADGALWMWGNNSRGQLGDGTSTSCLAPITVMDDVVAVSTNDCSTAAIKSDGSLWTWGENSFGQLGDGSGGKDGDRRHSPVKISENMVSVSMGRLNAVAIKSDGTLWTWGDNMSGQLGDGSIVDCSTIPTKALLSNIRIPGTPVATGNSSASTVIFQTNAIAGAIPVNVESNGTVIPPQIPTKEGYSFVGWYKDESLTKPWNFNMDKATDDITLYGKWSALAVGTATTVPNQNAVTVDGKLIMFEAYAINENNYFKLRDIAYVLNGTDKCVEVGWDGSNQAITLNTGKAYTSVGGELSSVNTTSQTVSAAPTTIYLNGQAISLSTYLINGNHFFKLRDLGVALNFGVEWDNSVGTISIKSNESYSADK